MQGECNVGFSVHTDNLHELLSLPVTTSFMQYSSFQQASTEQILYKMSKVAQRKQEVYCSRDGKRDRLLLHVFSFWWDHCVVSLARYSTLTAPPSVWDYKINGYKHTVRGTCQKQSKKNMHYTVIKVSVCNTLFLSFVKMQALPFPILFIPLLPLFTAFTVISLSFLLTTGTCTRMFTFMMEIMFKFLFLE